VLILPLTLLIFLQALLHPDAKIKLPLVELELEVREVLPLFLVLNAFMLYRAVRYARIVLWGLFQLPGQTARVAQIALDTTEAYKVNSPYYEEVLDPMAAAIAGHLRTPSLRAIGLVAFGSLNLIRSLAVYGLIFVLLLFMAFDVSRKLVWWPCLHEQLRP
jgi:hypothetical protein